MGVTGFFLLVLLPSMVSPQEPYGTVVTDIQIEGGAPEQLEIIAIAPGDPLTPEAVSRSIQALYDAGAYGRIEAELVERPDRSAGLVFHVEEPYFFSTVRMTPRTLFARSLSSYVNIPYGERFSRNRLDDIVSSLEEQLRAEGYFEFRLTTTYELDDVTRLATVTLAVDPGPRARVRQVRFEGGQQTLDEDRLRDALRMNPGSEFRLERLREGAERIRSAFADVRFLDTEVEWNDLRESYSAEEDAIDLVLRITPGNFALVQVGPEEGGGVGLSDRDLRALVPIYEEGRVDDDLIEEGRVNIQDRLYREGFYQAEVQTASIIRVPDESGTVFFQINFSVVPGARFSVEQIRIEGNEFFPDEVLYAELGISSEGLFRRGVVSPDLVEEAAATIAAMYDGEGFFDTEVTTRELVDVNQGTIVVILEVEEGSRLQIESVEYVGNVTIDSDELARVGNVYPGQTYTPGAVQAARSAITARYYANGHPDARVRARVARESDDLRVTYTIEEGPAYRVGKVYVAGNSLTREKVILRNSEALREDTPYNPQSILEAQRSLYATGLFSRVDIVPLAHERNGYRDVLIQIEDAGPLVLTYGIGVQDREGIRGTVEISHTNLWGLDRSISFRVRGSRREQRFQATYREPRLFNWELDGFASLFVERIRRPDLFDADRIDFSIQTLKQFRATESFLVSASYQTVDIKRTFPGEEGIIQIARVGTSYIHDSRRLERDLNPINPNRGNYFTGSFQIADQALGSEVNFTSFYGLASIYRPFQGSVLAAAARFGWNQPYGTTPAGMPQRLPITESYFAGGSTTLRAFRQDEVAGSDGRGGNALVLLNAEYRYPIPFLFSGFGGVLFYDTGTVFPEVSDFNVGDFTHTAGFGLRYETPLGPIRADLGFNLNRQFEIMDDGRREYEPHHTFHFTLGHAF